MPRRVAERGWVRTGGPGSWEWWVVQRWGRNGWAPAATLAAPAEMVTPASGLSGAAEGAASGRADGFAADGTGPADRAPAAAAAGGWCGGALSSRCQGASAGTPTAAAVTAATASR